MESQRSHDRRNAALCPREGNCNGIPRGRDEKPRGNSCGSPKAHSPMLVMESIAHCDEDLSRIVVVRSTKRVAVVEQVSMVGDIKRTDLHR
jgi:hypothetical protein